MGSQQTFQPTPSLITIPSNFPTVPTPGKLQILWEDNSKKLYRRLSPYTDYNQSLIGGVTQEPFFYTFADQGGKGVSGLKKYESRVFPIGSAPIDVIRVSKFLGSGRGLIFLGKQFLLQNANPYNETRVYNPTSPIVAAGRSLGFGAIRPQRNFDTSAGLAGLVTSLLGSSISTAVFGEPKINPPSGTVASAITGGPNATTGGKGLIRAGTADAATNRMSRHWDKKTSTSGIRSLFGFGGSPTQSGIVARSDEGMYGKMIADVKANLWYDNTIPSSTSPRTSPFQMWVAGGKNIRKNAEKTGNSARVFGKYAHGDGNNTLVITSVQLSSGYEIPNIGHVGHSVNESTNVNKPGVRYGDNVGVKVDADLAASDMMVNYKFYAEPDAKFATKGIETKLVNDTNKALRDMLNKLRAVSGGTYKVNVDPNAKVISSGLADNVGYDRLFATTQGQDRARGLSPMNYPDGVMKDYRNSRVVDNTLTQNPSENSLKLPTAGHFDALNTLTVLGKDRKIQNSKLKGWNTWQPYTDDQIAFFFYDVVNEKYIPFRAAIKGLAESSAASWEEMPFIGRGDKVYSYGGFNRSISFTISIVINSLVELAPTWQRINYLTTLVKPANYTTAKFGNSNLNNQPLNRFMIAPMVMLTLGDMYKEQPILIQSLTTTVPDDASWETSNETNMPGGWEYLASYLKAPQVLYGQLPRAVEINVAAVLLEKERAIVGGANFGHAPRTEDFNYWNTTAVPDGGEPNQFNKSLVVTKNNQAPRNFDADRRQQDIDMDAFDSSRPPER